MSAESYNKNKILVKNMCSLLVLVLLPLITLGTLSIFITQRYIKQEVDKNNELLLKQSSEKINMIIDEMDMLSLNFSVNPYSIVTLKHIFNEPSLSYEDVRLFTTIKSFIESQTLVKPYIHSIYTYYNNDNQRLIASDDIGLANISTHYDQAWYESFKKNRARSGIWSELRDIQMDSSRKLKILSIYKNLFTSGSVEAEGVIVLNIRPELLDSLLNSAVSYPYQGLVVVNENNIPIVTYNTPSTIGNQDIISFLKNDQLSFTYSASGKKYTISKYYSEKYGWTYMSLIPNKVLYEVPTRLLLISLVLFTVVVILGAFIALYMTRNNFQNFIKLIKILDSAKAGKPIPAAISRVKDEHSYIIQSVVKSFIEQNYLKIQLSERKYKMKVLELLALQLQINPHFLYNTLHTISWKSIALTKKPNEVSEMIENLSTILKYSLSDSDQMVSLEEEIYYTKCYLDIQFVRYRDKFTVNWHYDEKKSDFCIMKLILQPLIENSLYHGIKQKEEGLGKISIRIAQDGRYLKIWLVDNGVGIESNLLQDLKNMMKSEEESLMNQHIGLFNVNKRLILTYGEDYGIKIKSIRMKGTAIYIRVPTVTSNHSSTYERP